MQFGRNRQRTFRWLVRPLPDAIECIHHFRRPRKNGCRTFPLADFARYSISASSFGSTQMPLCAIRFLYGCIFRISGFSIFWRSAAEVLSKPWSTFPV
jgi:hypothetical protein